MSPVSIVQVFSPDADVTAPSVRGTYHQSEPVPVDLTSRSRPAVLLVGPRRREAAMEDIHDSRLGQHTSKLRDPDIGRMELWRYGVTVRAKAVLPRSRSRHH